MSYPQQIWCNSPFHFRFCFSHLAPSVLQPATKATCWKWCRWCHHHAFKPILPACVLFIQWLQPWKKDLPSRKVTWKWQAGKSPFFPKGYICKWWMCHCHVCFRGAVSFWNIWETYHCGLWPVSTFHLWKPSTRKDAEVLIPLMWI